MKAEVKGTTTDNLTLLALRQGDEQVFERVFREYYATLCVHARRYLIEHEVAEEVVQDMFYKMWERRESLIINSSISAYLYRAVTNHALNYIKYQGHARKYREFIGFRAEEQKTISAHDTLVHNDLEKQLIGLVQAMPERRRMIFEMSRLEGLRYTDIAERLGISLKTVEVQMSKALEYMREHLRDYLPEFLVLLVLSFFL